MIDLSVIVVNYNNDRVLRDCLPALQEGLEELRAEVIISDNGSTDGSVQWIRSTFPQFRILENGRNLGFAEANNRAFEVSRAKYIFLLNPDTVVLDDAIPTMVSFLDDNTRAGAVGCKLLNADRSRQISARSFPTLLTYCLLETGLAERYPQNRFCGRLSLTFWEGNSSRAVDWVSGAALMLRREILESIGGLDPYFFLTYDEVDFCHRIWDSGHEVWYIPDGQIVHLDRQSEPQSNPRPEARIKYLTVERNSRVHYFVKHHGFFYAGLVELLHLVLGAALLLKVRLFGTRRSRISIMEQRLLFRLYWQTLRRVPRACWESVVRRSPGRAGQPRTPLFVNPYIVDD